MNGKSGEDAQPGTEEAPLATISAGLKAAAGLPGPVQIHVALGDYTVARGEEFPWDLSGTVTLTGQGSNLTRIDGAAAATLLQVRPGAQVTLDGFALQGAAVAIAVQSTAEGAARLTLNDCLFATEQTGLLVTSTALESVIRGQLLFQDCRFQTSQVGVAISGPGPVDGDFDRCHFETTRDGVLLDSDHSGDFVDHALSWRDCTFRGQSEAGIHRRGAAGTNRGSQPYRIDGCRFERCSVGFHFEIPSGDSPLEIVDCEFLENELYGVRIVGANGSSSLRSEIVDSKFQWNGIGLYLVNHGIPLTIERNHIADNLGAGLFYGNFQVEPTAVTVAHCYVGHNGAAGLQFMADGHLLAAKVLYSTVVQNGRSGIERKDRRRGQSEFEIAYSIVANNGKDLWNLVPEDLHDCAVGASELDLDASVVVGDPGFTNPKVRDYSLSPSSPFRGRGPSVPGCGTRDLQGNSRGELRDWGALESNRSANPRENASGTSEGE